MKRWLRLGPGLLLATIVLGFFFAELGWPVNALYPPGSEYSDLMLTHWPNANWMRQSVWRDHCWPLWNPTQLAGVPFAANPLSGLWYLPNWLLLVLPLTPGLNLLLALHLVWGGWGVMGLCRRLVGSRPGATAGALVGAVAWSLTPRLWAHLGAGHVGMVFAAGWLPWVALAAVRVAQQPRRVPTALAVCWSLQFLADPRLAAYTAVGVAAAGLWQISASGLPDTRVVEPWVSSPRPMHVRVAEWLAARLPQVRPWLLAGLLALGLTAVQWLPLAEYLPLTSREGLTASESAAYSLPPRYLIGLLWADRGGFQEWMTYLGVSVITLAVVGWFVLDRRCKWSVALSLALLVLFALGDHTPLFRVVSALPGATLLRVPPRVWFLVSLIAAALAGLGGAALFGRDQRLARYRRPLARLAVAAVGAAGLAAVGVWWVTKGGKTAGLALAAFGWLLAAVVMAVVLWRGRRFSRAAGGLFLALMVAELVWMDSSLVVRRPAEALFADGWETGAYLARQSGRVYAPSFRPAAQVASAAGLGVVNGVDPLHPQATSVFLSRAAGLTGEAAYSVTLPPIPPGESDATLALADLTPDPWLLAVLGVSHVVSQFPITSPWLTELFRHERENLVVYRNRVSVEWPAVFRRVVSAPDLASALDWLKGGSVTREAVVVGGRPLDGPAGYTPAEVISFRPNRVTLAANGPGLLVASEVIYPGWQATVDGMPIEIVPVDGILRGVYLEEGPHQVEMEYRPWTVLLGGLVTGAVLLILAVDSAWRKLVES